jgi:hypothetical protein
MLASIVPLVERARNRNWQLTIVAYILGSVVGGALLGGLSGLLGAVVLGHGSAGRRALPVVVAVTCTLGAALDLGVGGLRLPSVRRQVNGDWLHRYRGWVYGIGYGVQLGFGVATIVTSAIVYLVFVFAFLAASWPAATLIGAAFGLARAAPILTTVRIVTPTRLREYHQRMQRRGLVASRAIVGVQGAVAAVALVRLVMP